MIQIIKIWPLGYCPAFTAREKTWYVCGSGRSEEPAGNMKGNRGPAVRRLGVGIASAIVVTWLALGATSRSGLRVLRWMPPLSLDIDHFGRFLWSLSRKSFGRRHAAMVRFKTFARGSGFS